MLDQARLQLILFFLAVICSPAAVHALDVRITPEIETVEVMHAGKMVTIMRNQSPDNRVNPEYAGTSRKCPPFCIQPLVIAAVPVTDPYWS
jgi:hypothetical protein